MARGPFAKLRDYVMLIILVAAVIFVIRYLGLDDLKGQVIVVDGDSLRIGEKNIRLYGIDAPELHQTCQRKTGASYACGRAAKAHLKKLIGRHNVSCRQVDTDRYNREVSICKVGTVNLNNAMVEAGWAIAYLSHSFNYARAEARARKAYKGIWQGNFQNPQYWRADHR